MRITKLSKNVGVEVTGLDLSEGQSEEVISQLKTALSNTGLLVIRNQSLEPDVLLQFSNSIGEIRSYTRSKFSLKDYPDILVLSNVKKNGKGVGSPISGRVWHIDGHYVSEIPRATILSMKTLHTQGGNTSFANMQRALQQLPEKLIPQLEKMQLTISRTKSREYNYPERGPATPQEVEEWVDVTHPIVLQHPVTGRCGLGIGGNVPWKIPELDTASSLALVTFLQEWVIQPEFVYEHVWCEKDLIVWDNWVVMHKASPYIGDRLLHRTTVF